MPEIITEKVTLKVDDGTEMRAFVARPDGSGKSPGMMVFQEAFGVTPHIRDVTERVAREGYVAIAPELFHRSTAPGSEFSYNDFPAVMPHMQALSNEGLASDCRAAYTWLTGDSRTDAARIGCVGFCLGGRTSFHACAAVPLQAAVSFYGGAIGPSTRGPSLLHLAPNLHAPILFFWGGRDKNIQPDQTRPIEDALRAAAKEYVNVDISFADHAFFRDGGANYDTKAAAMAWTLTKQFLETYVKSPAKQSGAGR
ncbi:MAG TPA: dienelactone hydrolase family protein [Candidatus Acidoferrum sp.]|jgi:carboxymethylenebutenolidase|nr:dienelactone hydrolase family protein [Candidatus Acidoferrum sp.]